MRKVARRMPGSFRLLTREPEGRLYREVWWYGQRMDESAEMRWGNITECPSCESEDIERQTADEGRPFSCNFCGLEFFKDTGDFGGFMKSLRTRDGDSYRATEAQLQVMSPHLGRRYLGR